MKEECHFTNYSVEEKKQAAADVLDRYSQVGHGLDRETIRHCDLRLHLMKDISELPAIVKKEPFQSPANSDAVGEIVELWYS
ncbi:hypothetical protein ACJRO7_005379 [Eucalyptus globulus]|uniref:Uncharacterized protein n=1 Tax=Eucalyptus globulus TaxID=34317 RepID=A0ABD3J5P0_EUCGL